jgi:hypothetical protein
VRTSGDYGTQSEPPTHPELLDYLALDFTRNGWSLKNLHREIVLSATFQQQVTGPNKNDPENRLLSSYPYRRLPAEMLRDCLLSSSGQLVRMLGGPGVYPPQPAGVTELAYGGSAWPESTGADRFRRSVYTFRKRTAPFAAYTVFDAPTGEICIARRDQSTTPMQSLTLLNDPMFMELYQHLAERSRRELGNEASSEQIIERLFQQVFQRPPSRDELNRVLSFADELAIKGDAQDRWSIVARVLANLDEAITFP